MAEKTISIAFRCPESVVAQLDELCRMAGCRRSEFLITSITSEYDKMNGNPKLKEIMEQFRSISEQMKALTGQSTVANVIGSGATDVAGDGGEGEA